MTPSTFTFAKNMAAQGYTHFWQSFGTNSPQERRTKTPETIRYYTKQIHRHIKQYPDNLYANLHACHLRSKILPELLFTLQRPGSDSSPGSHQIKTFFSKNKKECTDSQKYRIFVI